MWVYVCVFMNVCMYVCTYVCVCVRVCVLHEMCAHVRVRACVCTPCSAPRLGIDGTDTPGAHLRLPMARCAALRHGMHVTRNDADLMAI